MSTSGSSSKASHRLGEIMIHEGLVTQLLNEFRQIVETAVANETAKLRQSFEAHATSDHVDQTHPAPQSTTGVFVAPADKLKAVDLRTAFLLGKLPEDAGMLIDTKTTARLLNISPKMLYRLDQVRAVPEPVRLGRLVRWRLAEIIEWIDSDCPPRYRWIYSGQRASGKRKSR